MTPQVYDFTDIKGFEKNLTNLSDIHVSVMFPVVSVYLLDLLAWLAFQFYGRFQSVNNLEDF